MNTIDEIFWPNDIFKYREICDYYPRSIRGRRRQDAKYLGPRPFYNHQKNRYIRCAIEGSKGLQIEAMINGDKIVWFDTLVRGQYVD